MTLYSIFEKAEPKGGFDAVPVAIPEKFSWGAALFTPLYALAHGMWLMSSTAVVLDIPARARSVYDITGAGDTVVATLAVALGRGLVRPAAIGLANVAAGIAVGKAGTASVSLDEIAAAAPPRPRSTGGRRVRRSRQPGTASPAE